MKNSYIKKILILSVLAFILHISSIALAQDDLLKLIEKKQLELKDRELFIKQEEKRLETIKKDVDEKIEKYTKILSQIENVLKKIEQIKDQNFEHIVKTYETMPPEDAAERLSSLDEELLVKIFLKMKPKKTAAILAAMDAKKAAVITKNMSAIEKKIPIR